MDPKRGRPFCKIILLKFHNYDDENDDDGDDDDDDDDDDDNNNNNNWGDWNRFKITQTVPEQRTRKARN